MSLKKYKELMVDEWKFHKRNPEMFLVWIMVVFSFALAVVRLLQ